MKSKSRRYEVLLPVRFNDGRDVPEQLLGQAVNDIVEQFNAVTFYGRRGPLTPFFFHREGTRQHRKDAKVVVDSVSARW
jgi:hypothetical protein